MEIFSIYPRFLEEVKYLEELRQSIVAALIVLAPQLRGLQDLYNVSLSDETKAIISKDIDRFTRRREACVDVLDALFKLEVDGFPAMPQTETSIEVLEELAQQLIDVNAAVNVYTTSTKAEILSLDFGEPVDKE